MCARYTYDVFYRYADQDEEDRLLALQILGL